MYSVVAMLRGFTYASCLVSLLLSAPAWAEPREIAVATTLRRHPGEKEPAVVDVPLGAVIEVLREQDRWLFVRYRGQEGFITRTTIKPRAQEAPPRRGWGQEREGEALRVRPVRAGVALRASPAATAEEVASLPSDATLAIRPNEDAAGWIAVRDAQGRDGWVARADVENAFRAGVSEPASVGGAARPADAKSITGPRSSAVRVEGSLGARTLGMTLTSHATGGLTNYVADADAAALSLTVDAEVTRARLILGVDALLSASASSPGISYPGPTSNPGQIPFRTIAVSGGVRAGLSLRRALGAAARLGVRYDAFLPRDVDNVGMLPREHLIGTTAGVRLELAPPNARLSASVRLDVLVIGLREQTKGLEDGASASPFALWGGLTVRYAFSRRLAFLLAYDFDRATTTWSGASVRSPGVTGTRRTDTAQLTHFGLSAAL